MAEPQRQYVTIGCVNYQSVWGDVDANLEKMKKITAQAAEQGINLLVFPELALSGYECDDRCMHASAAQMIPGPASEEMARTAVENDVYVVFGMPERDSNNPDARYITSVLVGPEGLIGRYRKIHLARPPVFTESLCFAPGKDLPVFKTRYGRVGIQSGQGAHMVLLRPQHHRRGSAANLAAGLCPRGRGGGDRQRHSQFAGPAVVAGPFLMAAGAPWGCHS